MNLINVINSLTMLSLMFLAICMILLLRNFDKLEKTKEAISNKRSEKNERELACVRDKISTLEKFKALFMITTAIFTPLSLVVLVSTLLKISNIMTYAILGVSVVFEMIYFSSGGIDDILGKNK